MLGYFVGKTLDGRVLTHDECADIMVLPVVPFIKDGDTCGERDGVSKAKSPHALDSLISTDKYTRRALSEMDGAVKEEIERQKAHSRF